MVIPIDPVSLAQASLPNDGTSSPMVAPDGKVFFGVLESPGLSNNGRGWLMQYTSTLVATGFIGAFGWDDTPSIVPISIVPSYAGTSPYLLMTKYNNYANAGTGNGVNKIAVLDPNASQADSATGATVMKEVLTIQGVTPDSDFIANFPRAVREWCINAASVDTATHCVLAGSEDGRLYRWDLHTNTFTESITLTPGVGEAYTPTVIARDGKVLAINNATIYAVGSAPLAVDAPGDAASIRLAPPAPNPFARSATLRFSMRRAGRAVLEVFDTAGRRVARVLDLGLAAGDHSAEWDGRASSGAVCPTGIYFARLKLGAETVSRRLVLAH
jgi:hypothetical protein